MFQFSYLKTKMESEIIRKAINKENFPNTLLKRLLNDLYIENCLIPQLNIGLN